MTTVTPAKAGVQKNVPAWIPAFEGMTKPRQVAGNWTHIEINQGALIVESRPQPFFPIGPMQTARHILSTLLVFGLLTTGVPLTEPEDANRDKRVDLEDAILCVRDLVQTAETPGSFAFETQTAISVLHHVAGLKRSIRPVNETKSKPASLTSLAFYLIPSVNTPYHVEDFFSLSENWFLYESLSLEPPTPPPEMDCSYFMASAA